MQLRLKKVIIYTLKCKNMNWGFGFCLTSGDISARNEWSIKYVLKYWLAL